MKVFLCMEHSYNYCDEWHWVEKVVDTELKAYEWQERYIATDTNWRSYKEVEVE